MLTPWLYLISLVVSIGCLVLIDWRYKLAFWSDRRRTIGVFVVLLAVFLVWDLLGIGLGIFFIGSSEYLSGIVLLPELPIEEVAFLSLLIYTTLLIWRKASM